MAAAAIFERRRELGITSTNAHPDFVQLEDIAPTVHPSCDDHYAQFEREVITPALTAAGVEVHGPWRDGERDSFGPLSRIVDTDVGTVVYG